MTVETTTPKPKKKRGLGFKIMVCLSALIIGTVGLVAYQTYRVVKTADATFKPLKSTKSSEKQALAVKEKRPLSFLILGSDARTASEASRSDVMILATLNPAKKTTTLTSIPRDTYVEGTSLNKINSAYADGGAENAIEHVNTLLNTKIDYYAALNFEGLVKLVDAVGGIDVTSALSFTTSHTVTEQGMQDYQFDKGLNHLSGKSALAYVRERYNDPSGDYGRQNRQKQVIEALLKKLVRDQNLMRQEVLTAVSSSLKTDVSWSTALQLFNAYQPAFETVSQETLTGVSQTIKGLSYQVVSSEQLQRTRDAVANQLKQ